MNSGTPQRGQSQRDLRRRLSRQAWLTNRARNALRRPAFIGAISVGTFVIALVSMVVVPRAQRRAPAPVVSVPRPDTVGPLGTAALGRLKIAEAESALVAARDSIAARAAAQAALLQTDTMGQRLAYQDSLRARVEALTALLARAEQAPLPSSYRALADAPDLRSDPRMRALVDSLDDVEREREGFGAVGGVDPIFVALTSRANDIGRAIQAIASARRAQLAAEAGPAAEPAATVAQAPEIDTMSFITARDSLQRVIAEAQQELLQRRAIAQEMDLAEERARERANAVAPPLALLTAAFVLSAVIGFGIAFFAELRRPRVSDGAELERYLGVRVLAAVETPMPSAERGRREADRAAPPYFDPGAEAYQLTYLGLATGHPSLLMTTVSGEDQSIAAVVAANLAGVAAGEARNTLVVDLEPTCRASAALRTRMRPGISDIVRDSATWPDVTVPTRVGRDRTVDVIPCGGGDLDGAAVAGLLERDASRLARYYDAIFVVAAPGFLTGGLAAALPSPDVIFCAQPGITPLRWLKVQLEAIAAAGGAIRGIVLWNADRPLLPPVKELASATERESRRQPPVPAGAA